MITCNVMHFTHDWSTTCKWIITLPTISVPDRREHVIIMQVKVEQFHLHVDAHSIYPIFCFFFLIKKTRLHIVGPVLKVWVLVASLNWHCLKRMTQNFDWRTKKKNKIRYWKNFSLRNQSKKKLIEESKKKWRVIIWKATTTHVTVLPVYTSLFLLK